ncbi:hypothetical protein CsatB_011411 [Cannabis sativa]
MEMDGDGDMDSLFEGMVLFNPISEHPSHSPSHSDSHSQSESESHSLFTDLTILSPSPSLSESKSFNQIQIQNNNNSNHKKKKRPALRIGYARNASAVAFDDNPPISDDHQHLPSSNEPPSSSVDVDFDFRLLQIKNQISEMLEFVRQLAASVSADRKEAIANRRKAAQTLHRASNAYAELETRLDEACRSEDFETAETLSESLAAAESEKQTLVAALADAEARCEKL